MGGDGLTFRVFTNDRGKKAGVPMYSALTELTAANAGSAQIKAERRFRSFGLPDYAPVKAIEWPPSSEESKAWLAKYVQ